MAPLRITTVEVGELVDLGDEPRGAAEPTGDLGVGDPRLLESQDPPLDGAQTLIGHGPIMPRERGR